MSHENQQIAKLPPHIFNPNGSLNIKNLTNHLMMMSISAASGHTGVPVRPAMLEKFAHLAEQFWLPVTFTILFAPQSPKTTVQDVEPLQAAALSAMLGTFIPANGSLDQVRSWSRENLKQ